MTLQSIQYFCNFTMTKKLKRNMMHLKMFLLVSGGTPYIRLECIPSTTLRQGIIQLSLSFQKCGHECHILQIILFIDTIFFKKS